jgi:signal transduction histidine kinase
MTGRARSLGGDAIPGMLNPDSCRPRLVDDTSPRSPNPRIRHDLKNQLAIILGFSELLLADIPDDDPRRPDLAEIRGATEIAMQLVRSL